MSVQVDNLIMLKLVNYLNANGTTIGLPCIVKNNEFPATGEALWIKTRKSDRVQQNYIGGSYRGSLVFELFYQYTSPELQTGGKSIMDLPFAALSEWLEDNPGLIQLDRETAIEIKMDSNVYQIKESEDGATIQYKAIFELNYTKNREIFHINTI